MNNLDFIVIWDWVFYHYTASKSSNEKLKFQVIAELNINAPLFFLGARNAHLKWIITEKHRV